MSNCQEVTPECGAVNSNTERFAIAYYARLCNNESKICQANSQRRIAMKLTPPKEITFWIAVALGVLGLLGKLGIVAQLAAYDFWLAFFGLLLLVIALMVKGL